MEGIVFRCMYENCVGGVIFSGTTKDTGGENELNFKYVAAANHITENIREMQGKKRLFEHLHTLNYFILGSYTIPTIQVLIQDLKIRSVEKVILPYVPPEGRLRLLEFYNNRRNTPDEVAEFLVGPEEFLRKRGVKDRIFLYHNGPNLSNNYTAVDEYLENLLPGEYFESWEGAQKAQIEETEGHSINLRRAGYINDAGWFFYFGVYHQEGYYPQDTIVLFNGPLRSRSSKYHGKLYASALNVCGCQNQDFDFFENRCLTCLHQAEYISFQTKAKEPVVHEVNGHFLLGSYNMNDNMGHMLGRFSGIREMIRVIGVSNCGESSHWNRSFPSLFTGDYSKYWFINVTNYTDSKMMIDIANTSPRNRFFLGSTEITYCIHGTVRRV